MRRSSFFACLIGIAACGGDGATTPATSPVTTPAGPHNIQFTSGNGLTDTAAAVLVQPLLVIVHDTTGALAPLGTVVRFSAVSSTLPSAGSGDPSLGSGTFVEAFVQSLTDTSFQTFVTGTTDAGGHTGVFVKLGDIAGPARIVISVPTLGITDTARFTVTPGAPTSISVQPGDTTLYSGQHYTLTGGVTDQYGNTRPDAVTWSTSSGLTVSSTGVVTTSAVGRYTITVTDGTKSASSFISVVPAGQMVAWQVSPASLVTFGLDGSHLQTLVANVVDGGIGVHPEWIPKTTNVIYTTFNGTYQVLQTVNAAGVVTPFFPTAPPNVSHQAEPAPSANGGWIYFSAYDTRCSTDAYCLYRAHTDGSSPQLLGTYAQQSSAPLNPAPSPDGSKVAFVSASAGAPVIKVLDTISNTLESWSVPGSYPSWSPQGTQIAYRSSIDGTISVVNTDGTNAHAVTPAGRTYAQMPIAWSPDGQWIVARGSVTLEVVNVQTSMVLPLPYTAEMYSVSWR